MQTPFPDIAAFDAILQDATLNDVEKLARTFELLTNKFITQSDRQRDYAQALGDSDAVKKEHIKIGVMGNAREIFEHCYRQVTGERGRLWHE